MRHYNDNKIRRDKETVRGRLIGVVEMAHAQKPARGGAGGGKAAPKKKGPSAAKKVEDDREETLQAVVWVPT